ncbi:secreted RxLR effector protein 161-like [Gossypium raimondii]|uniref:secreted RxLR effector protein 161-like n=1 Tax=Gossypium raimondii TaxID=29730 RepID=UPI00227C0DCF|nr:secreted RxLR effector protein 161-like [Gossypium raimondii]
MTDAKLDVQMTTLGFHLSLYDYLKTAEEKEYMSKVPYASTIESLMYVMLCTRLDICFAVGMVSRYQTNPGLRHWQVVKHIFRYIKRTKDYMLVYSREDLTAVGYIDSDFQTYKDSRKSMSRNVFVLGRITIVWRNVKQTFTVESNMDVEYMAASEEMEEAI